MSLCQIATFSQPFAYLPAILADYTYTYMDRCLPSNLEDNNHASA
jgi:hypothetical protein